jgi:hypothetical protein
MPMNSLNFAELTTVECRIQKRTQRVTVTLTNAIWLMILVIFISMSAAMSATNMTPVAVTGFNRDIVIESTASGPPYGSYALEFNPGEGNAFYQSGLPGTSYGLPASGSFTSAFGDGTVFQFQPYTSSNALVLSSETALTSGTLKLLASNTFSSIAIIANSANATATSAGTLTLTFNDGSTFVTNYYAPDWFGNSGYALEGTERIALNTGATQGATTNPRFYQTSINLAALLGATNKPLVSLTFGMAAPANSTGIYAVSGLPTSAIALPAVTNVPAINIQAKAATLSGQITATGGEAPATTIFYGTTDGGTNATLWTQNIALGLQGGAFAQTISGLTPNTLYYFSSRAVNSAGTNWAMPSATFHTPPLTVPVMANQPASNVQGIFATLNGQILSTGGETPTVTMFYGPANGGSTPGAWAHSISLGQQTGAFAQTVTGLSPSTLYYFTANATNSAGPAWAAPSQTFTTTATNTPSSFVAVLTQHNDSGRTGMNLNETFLNVTNVNTNQFGLLFSRNVDDQIYAQPLVMTNVNILGRGTHNIVLVATVNDSVYAFDADNPQVSTPYWTTSFINPPNIVAPANTDMSAIGACGGSYQDFSGNIGIVGTPVIDPVAGTIYLVARTKEFGSTFVQRLHALDVSTGAERPNSPVIITATYAGTGDGNVGGVITFDPIRQNQRPGLALVNGTVYISWSSHCDNGPYHGWVIGYDQTTLQRVAVYNDTPNGSDGGIWMSGQAPAADANGNLYLVVGNGTVDTTGGPNRGESFLKLTRSGTNLTVASWFTPYDWQNLENGDIDLGCGGLMLIPGTTLAFSGGKEGIVYLVNRDSMGGLTSSTTTNNNIVQSFPVTTDEVHGGAVWWDGPGVSYGYLWPSSVYLQQYVFNHGTGKFMLPAFAQSPTEAPNGQPGGILALSANGTNAGTAIIWAVHQVGGDANQQVLPGILHAYSAQNVGTELWNSEQLSSRDTVGKFAKFVPPTVANGKVYMATFASRLNVYGLQPPPPVSITQSGGNTSITWPTNTPSSYTLQSTTNLVVGTWIAVTNSVAISNGVYQVTVPAIWPTSFYRLKL